MKRPVLLLDVDGVLADFTSSYLEVFRAVTGVSKAPHEVQHWEFKTHDWFIEAAEAMGLTPSQLNRQMSERICEPGFCAEIEPYAPAVLLFENLAELADVYAVTAPWLSSPTWMSERTEWLKSHFGIKHTNVIHASSKHLIKGDVFVDDKVSNVLAWQGEWPTGHGIVFAREYNATSDLLVRGGWDTVFHALEAKAQEAAA